MLNLSYCTWTGNGTRNGSMTNGLPRHFCALPHEKNNLNVSHSHSDCHGSFPPTETDSDLDLDLDFKPYHYIVLCTTFSTGLDSDSDPCMDSFSNGYCTHLGTDLRPKDPNPNPSPLVEMSHQCEHFRVLLLPIQVPVPFKLCLNNGLIRQSLNGTETGTGDRDREEWVTVYYVEHFTLQLMWELKQDLLALYQFRSRSSSHMSSV